MVHTSQRTVAEDRHAQRIGHAFRPRIAIGAVVAVECTGRRVPHGWEGDTSVGEAQQQSRPWLDCLPSDDRSGVRSSTIDADVAGGGGAGCSEATRSSRIADMANLSFA